MKKTISAILILILTVCVSGAAITYAWFQRIKVNKLTANELNVQSSTILLISKSENGNYSNSIDFSLDDFCLKNITGDGVTFLTPPLQSVKSASEHNIEYTGIYSALPDTTQEWVESVPSDGENNLSTAEYLSFDVYFKSSEELTVGLSNRSSIAPKSTTYVGSSSGNLSNYGDFSCDCIAGAVRVSIIDMENPTEPCLIWIPNNSYELSYSKTDGWTMNVNGTPEDDIEGDDPGYYYFNSENVKTDLTDYITEIGSDGEDILTLKESEANPGIFTGHIKVNIWIEGCDREARKALAGGVMSMLIDFMAKN